MNESDRDNLIKWLTNLPAAMVSVPDAAPTASPTETPVEETPAPEAT